MLPKAESLFELELELDDELDEAAEDEGVEASMPTSSRRTRAKMTHETILRSFQKFMLASLDELTGRNSLQQL